MRHCQTCDKDVDDMDVMLGKYWNNTPPCESIDCEARATITKERAEWRRLRADCREFDGPSSVACAVCGKEIGAYETRQFGKTGAVHVWQPGATAGLATCSNKDNRDLYPFFYTDG